MSFVKRQHRYRKAFVESRGSFPHDCFFCGEIVLPWADVSENEWDRKPCVHHRDGDHHNEASENLEPSHWGCHSAHHMSGRTVLQSTRDKLSRIASDRGWPKSAEHIEKVASFHRGRKRSEETRAKLRAAWVRRREQVV